MVDPIDLYASIDEDGRLTISRKDGQPISVITHEEFSEECAEVIEFGCAGHAVKAMQCLLNLHGAHLEEDGIFGNLTQTALIIFQDQRRMPATGTCDLLTWEQLIRS